MGVTGSSSPAAHPAGAAQLHRAPGAVPCCQAGARLGSCLHATPVLPEAGGACLACARRTREHRVMLASTLLSWEARGG